MLLGPSRILTCPYCDTDKKVMSLLSGNTINVQLWSDQKRIAPMLPKISFVQKCPSCNMYYIVTEFTQGERYVKDEEDMTEDQGNLNFRELSSALYYLEGTIGRESETKIRMMIIQAFNDRYRTKENKNISSKKDDVEIFNKTVKKVLDTMRWIDENMLLKAELHREIGEFKESIETLKTIEPSDNFQKMIKQKILLKAQEGDSIVFCLSPKPPFPRKKRSSKEYAWIEKLKNIFKK